MTIPKQQENETVLIGGQSVLKKKIYTTTLGLTISILASSLVKMIEELKNDHHIWNNDTKFLLSKVETNIMNKLSEYAFDPEMVEKMADSEYLASSNIKENRDRIHKELFDFVCKSESEREVLISESKECDELIKEIYHLVKLNGIKSLRQCVISLRKGKNK